MPADPQTTRGNLHKTQITKTTTAHPQAGEVWRNGAGAIRHVRAVDDDGYSVTYSRPAPAHPDWITVLMRDWLFWVEATTAVRRRRATGPEPKDWSYMA